MISNLYTKQQILQILASRGCFIDIYTLNAFFAKNKIEVIFEDNQGGEFYDNNTLNLVLEGLSNQASEAKNDTPLAQDDVLNIDNTETTELLENITLSDGTSLNDNIQSIKDIEISQDNIKLDNVEINNNELDNSTLNIPTEIQNPQPEVLDAEKPEVSDTNKPEEQVQNTTEIKDEVQEGNISESEQEKTDEIPKDEIYDISKDDILGSDMNMFPDDDENYDDIDDMTLLSESFEAQEKLRQYVMSELSKKNSSGSAQLMSPASSLNDESNSDISQRDLNIIARTMAKKIVKYVGAIMAHDAKHSSKVVEYREENRRLTQKSRELEEQNRKLRLLLAESNKNLNSYKPSIFGLYKKVDPKKK